MDKSRLRDSQGRPLTQGLFLETNYDTRYAVYTLKDEDFEYEGVTYPSIKRLYLAFEDPIEYDFANKYFANWKTWQRICENKLYKKRIEEWREELELKMRSASLKGICDLAVEKDNLQAHKYILEKQWDKRAAGRPRTKDAEREQELLDSIASDYKDDVNRVVSIR